MIRKNNFGYELFECSKCGSEVDEFDDYCQICGKSFDNSAKFNPNNKFIALDFAEGEFNNNSIIVATLQSLTLGQRKFIVSSNSQIAMRVKYFVINGNRNYLEDGLLQESLIEINDFEELSLNNEMYFVERSLM